MANFIRKLLLLAVFIAPSLVIISADPLVPGVQGNDAPNPNNEQCITMTDARAQEVKQIIQEITDFIDNLAVKHEYFDVKLLKLDIGKYNGNSDSNTGLDLIVDDCQKPSVYDFSGDFSADSDDDDKSDFDTTAPVKKTYQVTHSSRDTQTNDQQVNRQTQAQTLDRINNQNGNNLDATNAATGDDYESNTDASNTTDSTYVDNPYKATNNVGTDQHGSATQTFTDNQQVAGTQQNVANQQYDNQNQQYDKNQQQGPIQQYGGNPQQNAGQVQENVDNAQQSIDVNKEQYTNVVQQNTIDSQQNASTTQRLTETNVQQLKQTDTVNNQQSTDQVKQITGSPAVTNAKQITEDKQQLEDNTQQFQDNFQSIANTDNGHLSQTSINEVSQGNVEIDQNTFQQISNQNEGSSDNGNDQRFNININKYNNKQVSQNPRYSIETLLLQSLKELIRIEVREQTGKSLDRQNTNFDRKIGGQSLNYQKTGNGRRNAAFYRPYHNYIGKNDNYKRVNVNYVRGNTDYDGKYDDNTDYNNVGYVNYNGENANYDTENVNYVTENSNYDEKYVNYDENNDYNNAGYVNYNGENANYDRENVNHNRKKYNYDRKNVDYDSTNVDFDIRDNRYGNNRYEALKYGQKKVVLYGDDHQHLSEPTTKFIQFIPNYLLEKKIKDTNGGPLLVHIASTPEFQQVTIL